LTFFVFEHGLVLGGVEKQGTDQRCIV